MRPSPAGGAAPAPGRPGLSVRRRDLVESLNLPVTQGHRQQRPGLHCTPLLLRTWSRPEVTRQAEHHLPKATPSAALSGHRLQEPSPSDNPGDAQSVTYILLPLSPVPSTAPGSQVISIWTSSSLSKSVFNSSWFSEHLLCVGPRLRVGRGEGANEQDGAPTPRARVQRVRR